MERSKNLILGFCAKQPFRSLEPFIASLRSAAYSGDVCILVEDVVADDVARLRDHGVIVERTAWSAQPRMTSMASRFFSFLDFLTCHTSDYGRVMLVDPTEIVLQSDPFAVPLPADIVYAGERRLVGRTPVDHDAVVKGYGESVANNIRDCVVSNPNATIGTLPGVLRYLTAMTHELASRTVPIGGAIDRGVHNFVVRMRPLRFALFDAGERVVASMHSVPNAAVTISEEGALIGGRLVPVLSRWNEHLKTMAYVRVSPRFRLTDAMRGAFPSAEVAPPAVRVPDPAGDAVVAFYHRERDANWLPLFLGSLRCVANGVRLYCIGDFDDRARQVLSGADCSLFQIPGTESDMVESVAHLHLNQALEQLAADEARRPGQVLMIDTMRAVFLRDPFDTKTIGLSVFAEGPQRIADVEGLHTRLANFVSAEKSRLPLPIISSALLRGPLAVVHEFYRGMIAELSGRDDALSVSKLVQGLINKLCYFGPLRFPVTVHPNGAEAYFDTMEPVDTVDTRHGVQIAGAVPSVVLGWRLETPLIVKLRAELSLSGD